MFFLKKKEKNEQVIGGRFDYLADWLKCWDKALLAQRSSLTAY